MQRKDGRSMTSSFPRRRGSSRVSPSRRLSLRDWSTRTRIRSAHVRCCSCGRVTWVPDVMTKSCCGMNAGMTLRVGNACLRRESPLPMAQTPKLSSSCKMQTGRHEHQGAPKNDKARPGRGRWGHAGLGVVSSLPSRVRFRRSKISDCPPPCARHRRIKSIRAHCRPAPDTNVQRLSVLLIDIERVHCVHSVFAADTVVTGFFSHHPQHLAGISLARTPTVNSNYCILSTRYSAKRHRCN